VANNWWQEPLRIVQVNLQVVDTPQLDPDEVMRQLKEDLHANCVVFNAGGIYAWYPTDVPSHIVNPHMDGRDLLGESVGAAHKYGMRYIARVDFSKADDSIYHQHPEWFAVGPQGQPRPMGEPRYGPWSLLYATCTNGAYCGEAVAHPALKEILSRYDVDGLFYNGASYRACHCGTCQEAYRALYGEELPADPKDFSSEWAVRSFVSNMRGIYGVCKAVRPDVPWLGHYGLQGNRDLGLLAEYADVPCSEPLDHLAAGHLEKRPTWFSGMTARLGRTLIDRVPPIVIIHACTGMVWRHTTLPEHEYRFWLSQVVAHGGNLWHTLTGIPNTQYDRRILDSVGSFNRVLEEHEQVFRGAEPVAPVAIVISGASQRMAGTDELNGTIEALLNHQIPFTFLAVEYLTPNRLADLDVVVLPNVCCLSDEAAAALNAYVANGGALVASFETGLYDERGRRRETPALADALGVRFGGHYLRDQHCSYMRLEDADDPLLEGIQSTQLIANELDALQVTTDRQVPLTLVPPFAVPDAAGSPPERASIPTKRTGIPLAVRGPRSLFFPGEIGRLVYKYRLPDHQDLLANAVRAVASAPMPVEVEGPHSLQVSLYRKGDAYLLHLVNATGERPLQDTIPVRDVRIALRAELGQARCRALIAGTDLECTSADGTVACTVPEIGTWEIVRFERA
jgi:hypothetical protein